MKRHINIPIFIPHLGCPNNCVFCNQHTISGVNEFRLSAVREDIERVLSTVSCDVECEIAFFGGSFTGIDRGLMIQLLEIANEYKGRVSAIRCSTRPDYISNDILDILERYGVTNIELGLQSVSDACLLATKRGHTRLDAENACKLIAKRGFNLGGQMMIGLPASTAEDEIETARFIISQGAKEARIYPTVVFKDTELCYMAQKDEYIPLSVDEAVSRSATVYKMLIDAGVKVLRVGLCSSENLNGEDTYFSGPNHPAIGELVENKLFLDVIINEISKIKVDSDGSICKVYIPKGALSKAIGQRGRNKERLTQTYNFDKIIFSEDITLADYEVRVEIERKKDRCI